MGEVYLGEKIGPEGFVKPVVLKCVLPQLAKDRAFVQLFLDEARLAALLNHQNIAQVYDFGLTDEIYYIAMEYVPGYTVDDIRRKLRSIHAYMPLEHVACVASQVCQGLHYAHTLTDANGVGLGLVHRDVSPHNLIVSIDGSVKIVDFGIAKARAGLTRVQAKGAVGKFGYMSPEQSRGEVVDGRSDVFSLGVCLWELATNERLHDPKLDRAPEYSPRQPVRSVEEFRSELPRQFLQILETALAIDPEDRYPDCQEMHLALERFLAAMTHYAGESALAKYIKDLVDGKIENSAPPLEAGRPAPSSALDMAGRYEEVFGVTMDADRKRTPQRPPPKSWETKKPPPETDGRTPSRPPPNGTWVPEVKNNRTGTERLELAGEERPKARSPLPKPHPTPESQRPKRGGTMIVLGIVAMVVLFGGATYVFKDQIFQLLGQHEPPPQHLTSSYRVLSDPQGARVFVDGVAKQSATPMEIDLIPDIEYEIAVKLPKFATGVMKVKATVGTDVRQLNFKLVPAGVLKVTSEPAGATISIDGRLVHDFVTPMTLDDVPANQELHVTAEVKGLPPKTLTTTVKEKKSNKLNFALGPPSE